MVRTHLTITRHPLQQSRGGIEPKPTGALTQQAIGQNVANGDVLVAEGGAHIEREWLIFHRGDQPQRHGYRSVIDIGNRERQHLLPGASSRIKRLDLIAMDTHLGLVSQPKQHG